MTYALTIAPSIMANGISLNWLARDKADEIDYRHFEIDALVASGDYFVALGSTLETISCRLQPHSLPEAADLQNIVEQLEYIGQQYRLTKKK